MTVDKTNIGLENLIDRRMSLQTNIPLSPIITAISRIIRLNYNLVLYIALIMLELNPRPKY